MAALPPSTDFTGSSVTEGGFKTAITALRDFLSGLLGTDGTAATARTALGALAKSGDTMTGDLLFTDATHDIGKSGATRPRDAFLSRNLTVGDTITGVSVAGAMIAVKTNQEGASATTVVVVPAVQHFHPSAVKFYVKADAAGAIQGTAYNVASITDVGVGKLRVTIANDFSSADWVSNHGITAANAYSVMIDNSALTPQAAGTADYLCLNNSSAPADPAFWHISGLGALA